MSLISRIVRVWDATSTSIGEEVEGIEGRTMSKIEGEGTLRKRLHEALCSSAGSALWIIG